MYIKKWVNAVQILILNARGIWRRRIKKKNEKNLQYTYGKTADVGKKVETQKLYRYLLPWSESYSVYIDTFYFFSDTIALIPQLISHVSKIEKAQKGFRRSDRVPENGDGRGALSRWVRDNTKRIHLSRGCGSKNQYPLS